MKPVSRGGQIGQGIVEFALTLPIFLFLLMGLINGTWLVFQQQSVINAARSAAREAAILHPVFKPGTATGCTSTFGEPSASQATPAVPVETAAQQGSVIVPINNSQLCATAVTSTTMTNSATQANKATVTVSASPTLASPYTVTATVTYVAHPLTPIWPSSSVTITSTSTETVQGG
jgi:Flp pilus assembly protein TadG